MSEVQTINIIEHADGELRVSSLIIAGRAEVQHKNVLELVKKNLSQLSAFGGVAFETRPFETAGGTQQREIAHLNEPQSTLLMTFMRNSPVVVAFKVELVKQFYAMRQALSAQPALPQSHAEALRELADTVEQKALLEAKVLADEPKVAYVDTYVADNDVRLFRFVAQQLGLTESQLRADLIERGWIYKESQRRRNSKGEVVEENRYSAYSHKANYFDPIPNHQAPPFRGGLMHTLKITPPGAAAIARLYGQKAEVVVA